MSVSSRTVTIVLSAVSACAVGLAFLLAPGTALAQSTGAGSGLFGALSGQLTGLALAIVLAPLLGVLAHKYLPAGEKKVVALVDASPFFKQHDTLAGFTKLFVHDLDLELIKLSDTVVADAKAEGRFDSKLASKVKDDAISSALDFIGQSNRDDLAKTLGITVPGAVDEYLNRMLEARLATLKAQGIIKPVPAPAAAPALQLAAVPAPAVASVP